MIGLEVSWGFLGLNPKMSLDSRFYRFVVWGLLVKHIFIVVTPVAFLPVPYAW